MGNGDVLVETANQYSELFLHRLENGSYSSLWYFENSWLKHPFDLAVAMLSAFFHENQPPVLRRDRFLHAFSEELLKKLIDRIGELESAKHQPFGNGNQASKLFNEVSGLSSVLGVAEYNFKNQLKDASEPYWRPADMQNFYSLLKSPSTPERTTAHRQFFLAMSEELNLNQYDLFASFLLCEYDPSKYSRFMNNISDAGFHPLAFRDPFEIALEILRVLDARILRSAYTANQDTFILFSKSDGSERLCKRARKLISRVAIETGVLRALLASTSRNTWSDCLFLWLFLCCIGTRREDAFGYCAKRLGAIAPITGEFIGRSDEVLLRDDQSDASSKSAPVLCAFSANKAGEVNRYALFSATESCRYRFVALSSNGKPVNVSMRRHGDVVFFKSKRKLQSYCDGTDKRNTSKLVLTADYYEGKLCIGEKLSYFSEIGEIENVYVQRINAPTSVLIKHRNVIDGNSRNATHMQFESQLECLAVLVVGHRPGTTNPIIETQKTLVSKKAPKEVLPFINTPLFQKLWSRNMTETEPTCHVLQIISSNVTQEDHGGQCVIFWSIGSASWFVASLSSNSLTVLASVHSKPKVLDKGDKCPLGLGDKLYFVPRSLENELRADPRTFIEEWNNGQEECCLIRWGESQM